MLQMLVTFILITGFSSINAFTLCEYYEKLGVHKPECGHAGVASVFSDFIPNRDNVFQQFGVPLCRNYFHSCMTVSSSICESGTICSNGVGPGSCCTDPNKKRCPSVTTMNINCRKARGVNWCNSDVECRGTSTMASMCCPTGCNYNMCVHVGFSEPPMSIFTRNHVFSSLSTRSTELTCPDPYHLNVKCVSHRPTSWCLTDNECPQNSLHPRKCCTTLCGYNACVVRYNGIWQIA